VALSAFGDKSNQPTETDLSITLASSFVLWNELIKRVSDRFVPLTTEWGFSSPKTGWGLRLKKETRVILYMVPCKGSFLASFALGEKAVAAAHASDLPFPVLEVIDSAKKYAEGRGVRIEVRNPQDVSHVEKLAIIKMKT
jgi:hypothetical protein